MQPYTSKTHQTGQSPKDRKMNKQDYYNEVNAIAKDLVTNALEQCDNDADQAMDLINDSLLHEWIDGHEWIIYNAYHLPILQHSDNAEYMGDNFGGDSVASALKDGGLSGLHCALAFWALYADVMDNIEDAMNDAPAAGGYYYADDE